jgi:hypothetical protein
LLTWIGGGGVVVVDILYCLSVDCGFDCLLCWWWWGGGGIFL